MTTLLVVDDSAVDRSLMGGLLQRDESLKIEYAQDGVSALELVERIRPDIVITDLMMPRKDGLELVSELQYRFPSIPVILVTSRGSEDLAMQALDRGAASYVPKPLMGEMLLETVQEVIALTADRKVRNHLLECMSRHEFEFVLTNDSNLIFPLVSFLQEGACGLGVCCETEKIRLGVALEEALTNALYHGNLEVGSELRASDPEAYQRLIEARRVTSPFCERRIHVSASIRRGEARFVIRDEGPGFDFENLPDPTQPENLEKCCGRGVLLMRTFMDEVKFNTRGNEVTLIKRAPCAGASCKEAV